MAAELSLLTPHISHDGLHWSVNPLIQQGLTSHSTCYGSISETMFLQVWWPNQQCQST